MKIFALAIITVLLFYLGLKLMQIGLWIMRTDLEDYLPVNHPAHE